MSHHKKRLYLQENCYISAFAMINGHPMKGIGRKTWLLFGLFLDGCLWSFAGLSLILYQYQYRLLKLSCLFAKW